MSNILVTVPTTGTSVAVDIVSSVGYQNVKLVAGQTGSVLPIEGTSGIPNVLAGGMVVRQAGTAAVQINEGASVQALVVAQSITSATTQAGATPTALVGSTGVLAPGNFGVAVRLADPSVQISGAITIASMLVSVLVSGPVSISNVTPVTTAASVSVTGVPVWLNPTQAVNIGSIASTVNVAVVAGAGGGGSVTTAPPSISQSGQAVWIVGGQSTTAFPVWVSQINPPAGGGGSVTTSAPSISASGQIMWIVGGQSTTAFPVVVTGTVTAGAGTTVVSVQGAVPVTTQASVSVTGLPVWWNPTAQVVVSGLVGHSITGSVNIVSTVTVTGSVGISNMPAVSISSIVPVTTAASVSVSGLPVWWNPTAQVVVSGLVGQSITGSVNIVSTALVSIVGVVPVTTAASVSVTGIPVWLNPTQSVNIGSIVSTVLVNVVAGGAGGGSVTTAPPSISQSGQAIWVVGGQSTTANPIFVSQINAPAGGGGSVTTSSPSISATGQVMWIVGGQSTTAFPVVVTGTVTAGAGTTVISIQNVVAVTTAASVSVTGLPVWLNPTQQVVVTGSVALSTPVSISSIVPVTTAASVSVSGLPVWWNPTAQVVVSGLVGQSITGSVNIVSTALVSIVGVVPVTTAASVSVTGIPVWLNPTQAVNVGSIASTVNVAIVAGAGGGGSVTTTAPGITASGQVMWVAGGQSTTVSPVYNSQVGSIIVSGQVIQTTTQASGVTGAVVYLAASQTLIAIQSGMLFTTGIPDFASTGQIVTPKNTPCQPFMMIMSSTVGLPAGTTYLMTIWTGGTNVGGGLTQYAVPAGKVLRIVNMQIAAASAVAAGTIQAWIVAATVSASITSGSLATIGRPLVLQLGLSSAVPATSSAAIANCLCDIVAGTTIGLFMTMGTSVSQVGNVIVCGYLF